jgi:hypothetical protein
MEGRAEGVVDEVGPGLWTVRTPLRLLGAELGTRMTVVRIGEGGLALIAPCPIDAGLAAELARLGTVRALIAPNAFHHFYFADAAKRYPDAARFLAEGVAAKIGPAAAGARTLSSEPDPLWKADLEQACVAGAPASNEVVFFHPRSKTLVLTDLCFNFDPAPGGWTGLFLRLAGAHGRLAVSRLMRLVLRDREKLRATLARILEWDFERIVVTHGEIVRTDGKRRFREAVADL